MSKLLIAAALLISFTAPTLAVEWGPSAPSGYFSTH
jgi:hypothetical protein